MKQKIVSLFLIIVMVASAFAAVELTAGTTIAAAATKTTTTLTVLKKTPYIYDPVTFTATLKRYTSAGYVPLSSKSVTIWHYSNGVRVNDVTKTTDANGKITWIKSWPSAGIRTYYASYAGSSTHAKSTSAGLAVSVKVKTSLTLIASKTNPQVNEPIEFMARLRWWDPPTSTWKLLSGKSVTIRCYNSLTGTLDSFVTKPTEPYGQVIWDKSWAGPGSYNCYASFAGTSTYATSKSIAVNVNVHQIGTSLSFTVSKTTSNVGQPVDFKWTLQQWNAVQNKWVPLPNYQIKVYHDTAWAGGGVDRYQDGIFTTDANGVAKTTWTFTSPATRTYYAISAASNVYPRQTATSAIVTKYGTKLSIWAWKVSGTEKRRVMGYLTDQNDNGLGNKWVDIYRYVNNNWELYIRVKTSDSDQYRGYYYYEFTEHWDTSYFSLFHREAAYWHAYSPQVYR